MEIRITLFCKIPFIWNLRSLRRFYGRTSAWKIIREANKESITTDGRVRTGQTLRLPK